MRDDWEVLRFFRRMRCGLAVVRLALREIFDESAYARFLERQQVESSREAYAEFLRESEASRGRRPRCC
jgi:hypothetical protein